MYSKIHYIQCQLESCLEKKDSNIETQTSTNRPDNYVRQIKKTEKWGSRKLCVSLKVAWARLL